MDLNKFDIPDTAEIHLHAPGMGDLYEDGKPVTITIYGPASNAAVEYSRKVSQRVAERLEKRGNKKRLFSIEEAEQAALDRLIAYTAAVQGLELDGEVITPQNIRKIYADKRFGWLTDQVTDRLGGWEDFLG